MTDPLVFVRCFRCGYDLHGIPDDRPCPECGLLAERSRRNTDALRDARPNWLRSLEWGIWLMLISLAGVAVSPLVAELTHAYLREFLFLYTDMLWLLLRQLAGGVMLMCLILPIGLWLLTRREGYPPSDRLDARRRLLIRLLTIVPLVVLLGFILTRHLRPWIMNYWIVLPRVQVGLVIGLTAGLIPLPLLLMRQLENLAARTRSANLAEHCRIVGIGASTSLMGVAVIIVLNRFQNELGLGWNWMTLSMVSLYIILAVATAASLFWLWLIVLTIRFAISFRRARRESHRRWTHADLARSNPVV